MIAVIQILDMLINVLVTLVIVQMAISMLFAFNVVDSSNQFLWQIYRSINVLLDPVLGPIRRILPQTGAIDFSPIVLILGLKAIIIVLANLVMGA